jgi:hypothetical protein
VGSTLSSVSLRILHMVAEIFPIPINSLMMLKSSYLPKDSIILLIESKILSDCSNYREEIFTNGIIWFRIVALNMVRRIVLLS